MISKLTTDDVCRLLNNESYTDVSFFFLLPFHRRHAGVLKRLCSSGEAGEQTVLLENITRAVFRVKFTSPGVRATLQSLLSLVMPTNSFNSSGHIAQFLP